MDLNPSAKTESMSLRDRIAKKKEEMRLQDEKRLSDLNARNTIVRSMFEKIKQQLEGSRKMRLVPDDRGQLMIAIYLFSGKYLVIELSSDNRSWEYSGAPPNSYHGEYGLLDLIAHDIARDDLRCQRYPTLWEKIRRKLLTWWR